MDTTLHSTSSGSNFTSAITIRALIVGDVRFYREGLQRLLASSGNIHVVGAVASAQEAEGAVRAGEPHVVLLDVRASEARETLVRLRRLERAPKVLALALSETPQSVVDWAEAGIGAYVSGSASTADLMRALDDLVRDEASCSPQVTAALMRRLATLAAATRRSGSLLDMLTAREREVLTLLADGLSNKLIAARLRIQPATAKNHVHNILHKLELGGRVQAASMLSRECSRCI